MLQAIPLVLAAGATDEVAQQSFSGQELARCAGLAAEAQELVLAPGELAELELPSPMGFRSAGLQWHGDLGQAWVYFVDAAGLPTEPEPVLVDECLTEGGGISGDATVSGLVQGVDSGSAAVHLMLLGPARVRDVHVTWIAPDTSAFDHEDEMTIGYGKPAVYSRSSWGAKAPKCGSGYCKTTHIGIHHSASSGDFKSTSLSQCKANVKSHQLYHMNTNGWCDIGYNYLVCKHGHIFEGRAGGDNVKGAHDGYNCGSMGVCLMGYFHSPVKNSPTSSMINSLANLGAWKCSQQSINPKGSSYYAGYGGTVANVYGHRNVKSTACPGDLAYNKLGTVRQKIADKLAGGPVNIILDNKQAASFKGSWSTGTSASGKYGSDYRWTSTNGDYTKYANWTPNIPYSATYKVYAWWTAGSNRNKATKIRIKAGSKYIWKTVDQTQNGGKWVSLGKISFPKGKAQIRLYGKGASGKVSVADAIRIYRP